jgi:CheY-like chemotaxis protein/signal transduction histidine kinase
MLMDDRGEEWWGALKDVTRRLALTAGLDEMAAVVSNRIAALAFGTIWMAALEDPDGALVPVREVRQGREVPVVRQGVRTLDQGQRLSAGAAGRPILNVSNPRADTRLRVVRPNEPEWRFGLPRDLFESFGGQPFAYAVLLGSRGEPVGALALGGFHGGEPIPDEILEGGPLPILVCQLGIAMERAHLLRRIDWLESQLDTTRATFMRQPLARTVGELAGGVAHDLNNLSGAVLLALASIQNGGPSGHLLSRAERATKAIGDLSRRLQRTVGSVVGGHGRNEADLKQIVEDVAAVARPLCKKSSITVDLDLADLGESAIVMGDPSSIRQAVMGLVLNARETVLSDPPDRRIVEIRVDRRANEIGLTVHNVGLTFRTSPLAPGAPEPTLPHPELCAHLRVLVVDDEPEFIGGVQDLLRGKGHDVTSATDPADAFALAARERFDLVLMDHGLPRKSGLHLLHALRGQGVASKLVLMTGWDSDVLRADSRASHCDRILQKPFMPAEIDRLVGDLFAKA